MRFNSSVIFSQRGSKDSGSRFPFGCSFASSDWDKLKTESFNINFYLAEKTWEHFNKTGYTPKVNNSGMENFASLLMQSTSKGKNLLPRANGSKVFPFSAASISESFRRLGMYFPVCKSCLLLQKQMSQKIGFDISCKLSQSA